jgi:hypothetical protein
MTKCLSSSKVSSTCNKSIHSINLTITGTPKAAFGLLASSTNRGSGTDLISCCMTSCPCPRSAQVQGLEVVASSSQYYIFFYCDCVDSVGLTFPIRPNSFRYVVKFLNCDSICVESQSIHILVVYIA